MHFFSILDQLVAEIRVRDRNQRLRTLPSSPALETYLTILGNKPVDIGPGIGHNRSIRHRRDDTAIQDAILAREWIVTADDSSERV